MEEKKKKLGWFFIKMLLLTILVLFIGDLASNVLGEGLNGLVNYGKYGRFFNIEMLSAFIVLMIILLFKNSYIFNEKKEKLFKSIIKAWPLLIVGICYLVLNIVDISKAKEINIPNLLSLVLLAISIGLYEEFLCRGWIQNEFMERFGKNSKGVLKSIILSSMIFGLIHFSNVLTGQDVILTILQILNAISAGILLGTVYYKTKNIWSVIFIHAFWDFSLMLGEVNLLRDCGTQGAMPKEILIISSISTLLLIALNLSTTRLIFRGKKLEEKNDMNNDINKSYDERKEKMKKVINIVIILLIIAGRFYVDSLETKIDDNKFYVCYEYKKKKLDEMETHYFVYKDFSIDFNKSVLNVDNTTSTENYSFKIYKKDDKLVIKNNITSEQITLKYENINDFIVYENEKDYTILFTENDVEGTTAYMSNFIKKDTISNEKSYLEEIGKSFKKYDFPNIIAVGYIKERKSSEKYPLLKSDIYDIFTIYDEKAYKIE